MKSLYTRKSNIELFRIVLMLLIVAHHYVLNSGIVNMFDRSNVSTNMIFMQIVGGFGKTAINGFLLITGYHMCNKKINLAKWLSFVREIIFYNFFINVIFLIFNYKPQGIIDLFKGMFSLSLLLELKTGEDYFISLYLILYLLMPFINKLIKSISQKQHSILLIILLSVFSIKSTFLGQNWEGLSWYITVYLIGAWFQRYNSKYDSICWGRRFSVFTIGVACINIILIDLIYEKFQWGLHYWHGLAAANSVGSISIAVSLFILFKNLNIKTNKIINRVASATWGVLLIHANSSTMRNFLWNRLLNSTYFYTQTCWVLILHFIFSVTMVYIVCVLIDLVKQDIFSKISKKISKRKSISCFLEMYEKSKNYILYE